MTLAELVVALAVVGAAVSVAGVAWLSEPDPDQAGRSECAPAAWPPPPDPDSVLYHKGNGVTVMCRAPDGVYAVTAWPDGRRLTPDPNVDPLTAGSR